MPRAAESVRGPFVFGSGFAVAEIGLAKVQGDTWRPDRLPDEGLFDLRRHMEGRREESARPATAHGFSVSLFLDAPGNTTTRCSSPVSPTRT